MFRVVKVVREGVSAKVVAAVIAVIVGVLAKPEIAWDPDLEKLLIVVLVAVSGYLVPEAKEEVVA